MSWRSFLRGVGSIFNLSLSVDRRFRYKCPRPLTDEEAFRLDGEALRSDWEAVAGDLERARDCIESAKRKTIP